MRFTRTANGRLNLDVLDEPDYEAARRLANALLTTFRGRRKASVVDFGSAYLDIEIAGVMVTVHLHHMVGICVFAAEEAADGVIYDIGNYLAANRAVFEDHETA